MKSRMPSPSSEVRVRLPAALLRKLRASAAARGKDVGDVIVDAIRADLCRPLREPFRDEPAQTVTTQSPRTASFP